MEQIQKFRANWQHKRNSDKLLQGLCDEGSTLNLCCGKSQIGDLRIDIDPTVKPDLVADIFNLPSLEQFDNVIMDPPYSYYGKIKWLFPLARLARKRFIISTPQMSIRLRGMKRSIYVVDDGMMYLRIWQVYDRFQELLSV